MKIVEFENSIDLDLMAHNELLHQLSMKFYMLIIKKI